MNKDYTKIKKIIIITLIVITVLAAGFGIAKYIFGCFGGGSAITLSSNIVSDEISFSDRVQRIDVDMSVANIEITTGTSGSVQYLLPDNIVPSISESDGTLSIRQNGFGGIRFAGGPSLNEEWKIVITLPKDAASASLYADLDLGNMNLKDLTLENLSLDMDCGNATLSKVAVNGLLNVDVNLGNVECNDLTCSHLLASLDAGNLEIDTCAIDALEVEVNFGKAEIHGAAILSGSVKNDCGDIIIEGDIDRLTANDSLGSITVNTTRPESESGLTLNVDLGSITVNGHKWK